MFNSIIESTKPKFKTLSHGDAVGCIACNNHLSVFLEEYEDGIDNHWIKLFETVINPRISCVIFNQFIRL